MLELSERGLEPALSDVAPRTRDVRPDFDVHERHSLVESATNVSVAGWYRHLLLTRGPTIARRHGYATITSRGVTYEKTGSDWPGHRLDRGGPRPGSVGVGDAGLVAGPEWWHAGSVDGAFGHEPELLSERERLP